MINKLAAHRAALNEHLQAIGKLYDFDGEIALIVYSNDNPEWEGECVHSIGADPDRLIQVVKASQSKMMVRLITEARP